MSIRLNPNYSRARKPFFTPDVYKVLGAFLTIQATFGAAVVARNMLHLDTLTESADVQQFLARDGGLSLIFVFLSRMGEAIAWVLFARLAVTGFRKTSNPARYLARVALLALVSEVPFDLCAYAVPFSLESQNVVFALALGLWVLYLCENAAQSPFLRGTIMAVGLLWAVLLNLEYGYLVVIAMLLFYYQENRPVVQWAVLLALSALDLLAAGPAMGLAASVVPVALGLLLLRWYDDSISPRISKWVFYALYPLHLILIAIACATVLA